MKLRTLKVKMGILKAGESKEGDIINRWIYNRMVKQNKNILCATTGPTGSGKSYQDLRRAELWYKFYFNEPFPPENICFSIAELMRRISSGTLKKGELLIFEEAGANMGSLDFQNKVSKLFSYVLQTFRSLNIGILFNLPYLSMLNKSARMLIHVHFVTSGINHTDKEAKCKAFFRQVNQDTGKVYSKHLRVKKQGVTVPVKKFTYQMPSEKLCKIYESKKFNFVTDMTKEFSEKLDDIEHEKLKKLEREALTDKQQLVYDYLCNGYSQKEIAKFMGVTQPAVCSINRHIKKKGYKVQIEAKSLEKLPK